MGKIPYKARTIRNYPRSDRLSRTMAGTLNRNGRKPGSKNKHTTAIREAFVAAFDELGGVEALVEWGRANQTDFYKLASKLIPQEITGAGGTPLMPPSITIL